MRLFINSLVCAPEPSSKIDLFVLLGGQSNAKGNTSGLAPTRSELIGSITDAYIYNGSSYATLHYPNNN